MYSIKNTDENFKNLEEVIEERNLLFIVKFYI